MSAPDKIQVEYETTGAGESDYGASVYGYEYKNRDIRDFGYFDGEYLLKTPAREHAQELVEALNEARYALGCCYDVCDWPADGETVQDIAIASIDLALAKVKENGG